MEFLVQAHQKGGLHHAYLLEGNREDILEKLIDFLETKANIRSSGNPDFWHGSFQTIGIEEARDIKERQSFTSFSEGMKIFIVSGDAITNEAQNALLKVFEEPTPRTHFFLILPSTESLLPTFLSRLFHYADESEEKDSDRFARTFISAAPARRMTLIKPLIENKDKTSALSFLGSLEKILYQMKKDTQAADARVFEEIISCRSYLQDRSASIKIILEYVSVIAPVMS